MLRIAIIGLAGLLLAGCSQFADLSDDARSQQQWLAWQESASRVVSWDVQARAAVILKGEVYNVTIRWQQLRPGLVILLQAPFGQGVFRITSSGGATPVYQLDLPDGRLLKNESPEALLEEVIGWSLPIAGLEFWIRGLPQPGSSYSHRSDEQGRLKSLRQDDWSIKYIDYFEASDDAGLPRRLKLVHKDLKLKLVIERWQLDETDSTDIELFPEFN